MLKDLVKQLEGWVDLIVFVGQFRSPGPVAGERVQPFGFSLEVERIVARRCYLDIDPGCKPSDGVVAEC